MDDLDSLSTDELRKRAFAVAEKRRDVGFFWELAKHTRAAGSMASEDASSGTIGGSLAEAMALVRELRGKAGYGDDEPLLRARFVDYLRANSAG